MKPAGSMTDSEMLHLALSSMPGGRANFRDIVTWLMNHPNEIRWPNPDEHELKGYINNALFRALKANPPNVIAHEPMFPKTLKEYTLSHQ